MGNGTLLFQGRKGGENRMRTLKRLMISLMAAALVMGNVAALTTFTVRAKEQDTELAPDNDGGVELNGMNDEADDTNAGATDDTEHSNTTGNVDDSPVITPAPQQIVTAGGTTLEGAQAQAVLDFLDTLKVTEDFAVYADTYQSESDHLEGNIAVNHLESDNFLVKGTVSEEGTEGGNYSYIGEAKESYPQVTVPRTPIHRSSFK